MLRVSERRGGVPLLLEWTGMSGTVRQATCTDPLRSPRGSIPKKESLTSQAFQNYKSGLQEKRFFCGGFVFTHILFALPAVSVFVKQ